MNQFVINVIHEDTINPVYIKATSELIANHYDTIINCDDKLRCLQELWRTCYSAELEIINNVPLTIRFKTKHMLTLFLLRWG